MIHLVSEEAYSGPLRLPACKDNRGLTGLLMNNACGAGSILVTDFCMPALLGEVRNVPTSNYPPTTTTSQGTMTVFPKSKTYACRRSIVICAKLT